MEYHDIFVDYDAMSTYAADVVQTQLSTKPASKIMFPTGNTPIEMYARLRARDLDWSQAELYNLDEYRGNIDHDQSYAYFLNEHLYQHIGINSNQIKFIDDTPAVDYGPYGMNMDLCILGIGDNGHIAFNEPGSELASVTRVVNLTESTLDANSSNFPDRSLMPTKALTVGVDTIMSATKIIMLIRGKSDTLTTFRNTSAYDPNFPASALHSHSNCEILYCD